VVGFVDCPIGFVPFAWFLMLRCRFRSPQRTGWCASILVHLACGCAVWATCTSPMTVQRPRLPGQTSRIQLEASMPSPVPEETIAQREAETIVEISPQRAAVAQRRYRATSSKVERPSPAELAMVKRWMAVPSHEQRDPAEAPERNDSPKLDAFADAAAANARQRPPRPEVRAEVPASLLSAPSRQTAGTDDRRLPRVQENPLPVYPAQAIVDRVEGTVMLRIRVATDGSVDRVEVLAGSGHAALDAEALRAVGRWRFAPATRGGEPVAAWIRLPVRFRLH
jgi:protein TonB